MLNSIKATLLAIETAWKILHIVETIHVQLMLNSQMNDVTHYDCCHEVLYLVFSIIEVSYMRQITFHINVSPNHRIAYTSILFPSSEFVCYFLLKEYMRNLASKLLMWTRSSWMGARIPMIQSLVLADASMLKTLSVILCLTIMVHWKFCS